MATTLTNYDGSITTTPQQLVFPETVAEIQAVMKDKARFPSPVRAMGSHHSLTPCAVSDGTIINMSKMTRVVAIDERAGTLTAEAGLQYIDANKLLRKKNLQFLLNIEIGNLTLGSAACCHTKDGLDGKEFGQVSSYVTAVKWVNPAGELEEASEATNPDLLRKVRSSYGLCGVIYEVTLRVKPMEAAEFKYNPRPVADLTDAEVVADHRRRRRPRLLDGGADVVLPDQEEDRRSRAARPPRWPIRAAVCGTTARRSSRAPSPRGSTGRSRR